MISLVLYLSLWHLLHVAQSSEHQINSQCGAKHCCYLKNSDCALDTLLTGNGTLIFPGGETRCIASTSTDYAFEVYKGSSNRVLVYFQGGGSCWDEQTTTSSLTVGDREYCYANALPWLSFGIFDRADPRNAYSGYTLINILYCSGDNHVGNVTRPYKDLSGGDIVQKGAANVDAVLRWIEAQQKNGGLEAELHDLVVMGCSAGALAAQVWGNEVVRRLNRPARSSILIDSYVGYFPGTTEAVLMNQFGACDLYFLSDLLRSKCRNETGDLSEFLIEAMRNEPTIPYMFIQSRYDKTQINYYNYIVESEQFKGQYTTIDDGDEALFATGVDDIFMSYNTWPNFLVYFVDGEEHCFSPLPYMYTADTTGYIGTNTVAEFNVETETLMKWSFRGPLLPGEQIYSQCDDTDDCLSTSLYGKRYQQSDQYYTSARTSSSSRIVQQLQALPRYDSTLTPVHVDFNVSNGDIDWVAYGASVVPFPVIIYACGVFAVMFLLVVLLLVTLIKTAVYNSAKTQEDWELRSDEGKKKVVRRALRYMNLVNTMYCCLFVAFMSNIFIIIGNIKVSHGVDTAISSADRMEVAFSGLSAEATDLEDLGFSTRTSLELAEIACDIAGLSAKMDYYDEKVQDYSDAVSTVPDKMSTYKSYVKEWGVNNRNAFVWVVFVVLNLIVLGYALSTKYSKKGWLKCSIFFSVLVILLSFAFATVYMIALVVMSDFCSDPLQFTLQLTSGIQELQDVVSYYLTCRGNNPTYAYIYDADYSVRWLNYYVLALQSECSNPALQYASDDLTEISEVHFVAIEDYASCQTYYSTWNNFVDDGVCTDGFGGLYIVWIAQTVTAICLFVCTIVGIRLIPLLEKIDSEKFRLLDDDSVRDNMDSSHHSIELASGLRNGQIRV